LREDDEEWKFVITRPEAVAAAVRLATVLAENPAGLSPEALKQAANPRRGAVTLLKKFDAAGVLPPEGKAVLARLLALPPPPEEDKKD
jgi:hypothetical protein